MKKFLLIDDHFVVRGGMGRVLLDLYRPCEIHEAENPEEALEKLKKNSYDLIVMDVHIPKADMLGFMDHLHIKYPATKVLIFSMSIESIYAARFLKAGANGFLSKMCSQDEIKKSINLVLSNRKYISGPLAEILADSISGKSANPFQNLSAREFEIVSLLLSGHTQSDISKMLNLESSTVGSHKARIFKKLNISTILELKELETSYKS